MVHESHELKYDDIEDCFYCINCGGEYDRVSMDAILKTVCMIEPLLQYDYHTIMKEDPDAIK